MRRVLATIAILLAVIAAALAGQAAFANDVGSNGAINVVGSTGALTDVGSNGA